MKTRHAMLREQFGQACEDYFRAITGVGWSAERIEQSRRELAAAAVKLHFFEQGLRAKVPR